MIDADNQPLHRGPDGLRPDADGSDPLAITREAGGASDTTAKADPARADPAQADPERANRAAGRPRHEPPRQPRPRRAEPRPDATAAGNGSHGPGGKGNGGNRPGQRFRLLGADGVCVAVTLLWLVATAVYVDTAIGVANLTTMLPNEIGMFIAGVTAPVILLWFAVAHWRHAAGLTAEIRELRTASEQARAQAQSLAASEQHLRIDTYLKLIDFYLSEMAKHTASLATRTLDLPDGQVEALWARFAQGDREVFFRLFFEHGDSDLEARLAQAIAADPIASRSAHLFTGYWQVFLLQADQIDRGNLMLEAYKNGFLGELTRTVNRALYGSENPFN